MMEVYLDEVPRDDFEEYFRFVENIAAGAFGKVIRAVDLRTNEEVAVKMIDKDAHSKRLNMIKQEINILQQLRHKNIVKFLNFREANTKLYIVMKLLSGGTIKNLIEQRKQTNKPLTEEECSIIMKHLLEAVKYLHEREIVHRDIKPENVMFENSEDFSSLKLIDFGLSAQHFDNIFLYDLCGTLIYMAPEQLEKRAYSKPIDMWSCGMIMFILLNNGRHPFYTKGMSSKNFVAKLKNFNLDEIIKESKKNKKVGHQGLGVNPTGVLEKNNRLFPGEHMQNNTSNISQNLNSSQSVTSTHISNPPLQEIKMSKMARSLLQKLLEVNPSRRYTVDKALNHPWITRDHYQNIPETYFEAWRLTVIKRKFKQAFGVTLFLINYNKLKNNGASFHKKSRHPSGKLNLMQYALLVNKISKEQNEKFNKMRDKHFDPFFSSGEKAEFLDKKEKFEKSSAEQILLMDSNLLNNKFNKRKPIKIDTGTKTLSPLNNSPVNKNKNFRALQDIISPSPVNKKIKIIPSTLSNTSSRNNIYNGNVQNTNQSNLNNNIISNSNTNNTTNTGGVNYPSSHYSNNSSNLPSPTHSDSMKNRKEKIFGEKYRYKYTDSHTTGISQQNSNNFNNLISLDCSNIMENNELSTDKLRESLEDELKDTVIPSSVRKNLDYSSPNTRPTTEITRDINNFNNPTPFNPPSFRKSMRIMKNEDEFKLNLKSLETDSPNIEENYNPLLEKNGYVCFSKNKKSKMNSMSFNKLKFSELNLNTDVSKPEKNHHGRSHNNVMQGFSTPINKNIVIKKSYIINSKLEKKSDQEKIRMPINITKNLIDKIVVGKLHSINTNELNNLCYPNRYKPLGTPSNNRKTYKINQAQQVAQVQSTNPNVPTCPDTEKAPKSRKVSFHNFEINLTSDVVLPPIENLGNKNKTSLQLSKLNPSNNKAYYVFK
jgi:serine/threonine protein kinase